MQNMPKKVKGFKFAGIFCGIKEVSKKKDLALIYSEVPCSFAASFTTNRVKAPPVILDLKKISKNKNPKAQAILINSGNANACTGNEGLKNAEQILKMTAKALQISTNLVYLSSTGKIGIQLPMDKIEKGIEKAASSLHENHLNLAAEAITTTDLFPKSFGIKGKVGNTLYTLVGFAKGAGMIEPSMNATGIPHATMLAYFMTDLNISSALLQQIFNRVIDQTFNCITVDGDMSTNDTAMILANGLAGNPLFKSTGSEAKEFEKNLEKVARYLALKIIEDGEGATKIVELKIKGAKNIKEAKTVAYRVGRSELVKTSFFGEDPNWGRLLAAIGYSGATLNPSSVDIYYDDVKVVSKGVAVTSPSIKSIEQKAHAIMKKSSFTVTLDLKQGKSSFRLWTSDLTTDYVKLNAEYRT